MSWFKKRLKEPSTWGGLSALIIGIGTLFKANGVPEAGQAIAQNADVLASGDYFTPLAVIFGGLMATFMGEKKH